MQNSIYFDFETVFIYFLGDAVILYVLALLVVSAVVMQLQFISKWLQSKLFKQESKYSVLILEDWSLNRLIYYISKNNYL